MTSSRLHSMRDTQIIGCQEMKSIDVINSSLLHYGCCSVRDYRYCMGVNTELRCSQINFANLMHIK